MPRVSLTYHLSACLDYVRGKDYCPNCGDFGEISEATGWCYDCTKEHNINNGTIQCIDCSKIIPANHQRILCWSCKEERWLKKYGDAVEYLMLTGLSFSRARQMVADAVRPLCVVCSGPIKGGTPGESLFCSSTLPCKTARNKYRRLLNGGMQPHRAINQVLKQNRR